MKNEKMYNTEYLNNICASESHEQCFLHELLPDLMDSLKEKV